MSLTCIKQIALSCTDGGSNKVYIIQVQHDAATGEYFTKGYSGRRGSSLVVQPKYSGPREHQAMDAATRLFREKTMRASKPYVEFVPSMGVALTGMPSDAPVYMGAAGTASAPTSTRKFLPPTGPLVMLASVLTEREVPALETDSDWVAQQKYDGDRVTVKLQRGAIEAYNRKGLVRSLPAAVLTELTGLLALTDFAHDRKTVVDGELMGDYYVIYDILTLRDIDVTHLTYDERYSMLEALLDSKPHLLPMTAWGTESKQALRAEAVTQAWEGVIYRQLSSPYVAGECPNLRKFKLWAMASCRVLAINRQRSVQLGILNDRGDEEFVGNVTVPANQEIPELDALVEVRYLYAHDGGSLYQPVLQRIRTDIDAADTRKSLRKAPPEKSGTAAADSVLW